MVKDLIEEVRRDNTIVSHKKEELERFMALCGISGISFEERTSGSPNPHAGESKIIHYLEYKEELELYIASANVKRQQLMRMLDTLGAKLSIDVMYMYCLENRTMSFIAKKTNYTKQRIYQVYEKAVLELSERFD
jgi:DNA-directed RNA polymerase sigma subunit (sigma70/sigma32)